MTWFQVSRHSVATDALNPKAGAEGLCTSNTGKAWAATHNASGKFAFPCSSDKMTADFSSYDRPPPSEAHLE